MLTYTQIMWRSIKIFTIITLANVVLALALMSLGLALREAIADFSLLEAAVLFILAGIVDLSSSVGVAQLRKLILSSKEKYSPNRRRDEREGLVLLIPGLMLFALVLLSAIQDLLTRR